jgi:hypothetical protein
MRRAIVGLMMCGGVAGAEGTPSLLMHVEVVEGRQATDHAVFVCDNGDGEVKVDAPGGVSTKVKLRMRGGPVVAFEVEHQAADRTTWMARGETSLPAPGKRVVVARVPEAGGTAEVVLSR